MSSQHRSRFGSRAWCARWLLRLKRPLQWANQELEWGATTRRDICGIAVGILPLDRLATPEAQDLAFTKVSMGFGLIAAHDPRRLSATRRLLRGILIRPQPTAGYRPASNICILSTDSVLDRSHGMLASAVIHETMHARFAEAGLIPFLSSPALLPRMEEGCVREQIAFARRVPEEIFDRKRQHIEFLESELKEQWWTREEQNRRYREWREGRKS